MTTKEAAHKIRRMVHDPISGSIDHVCQKMEAEFEAIIAQAVSEKLNALQTAAEPFARVYRLNAGLDPRADEPMRDYTPGVWPTMGDLRKLTDLLG